MLGNPIEAWHAAFSGIGKRSSNGVGDPDINWEVVQGELAKVKSLVAKLPKLQRDAGMVMFAPEEAAAAHLGRVRQLVYAELVTRKPERLNSIKQIERLAVLVDVVILVARRQLMDGPRCSDADVARLLNLTPVQYCRDYAMDVRAVQDRVCSLAGDALVPVTDACRAIAAGYRQVA